MQQTISLIATPQFQDQPTGISGQKERVYQYLRQLKQIETYLRHYEQVQPVDDIEHLQINTYWNS